MNSDPNSSQENWTNSCDSSFDNTHTNPIILDLSYISYIIELDYSNFINRAVSVEITLRKFRIFLEESRFKKLYLGELLCLPERKKTMKTKKYKKIKKTKATISGINKIQAIRLLKNIGNSRILIQSKKNSINTLPSEINAIEIKIKDKTNQKQQINTTNKLKCENFGCGKKFYKKINYIKHFKLCQYKNKKHKCDFTGCFKSFSNIGNLRKHKIIHQEKKTYLCEYENCKILFTSLYNLKVHLRSHSDEKFYKCEIKECNYKTKDKGTLKYHHEVSHPEEENIFAKITCGHRNCKMTFKTIRQNIIHHNNLEQECKEDRVNLVGLIREFKKTIKNLLGRKRISENQLNSNHDYILLKEKYQNAQKNLFDSDAFYFELGEDFFDMPNYSDN